MEINLATVTMACTTSHWYTARRTKIRLGQTNDALSKDRFHYSSKLVRKMNLKHEEDRKTQGSKRCEYNKQNEHIGSNSKDLND